jgi:O-antigen/teichoic acid export membrane protein
MTDTRAPAPEPLLRRYAVLTLLDLGARACGFGATIWVARAYGVEGFGAIGLAQTVATYGLWASTCGLDIFAVRHTVATGTSAGVIASTVAELRLGLSAICYALLLAISALVPELRAVLPLIALYGLGYFTTSVSVLWVAQATSRTDVYGIAGLVTQGMYFACVALAISQGLGTWSVPSALLMAELLVALGLGVWMLRSVAPWQRPLPLGQALALLRQAAPIGGSKIMRGFALGSDVLLVGLLLGLEATGLYNGAFRLFLLGISMVSLYFVVLFPLLVRSGRHSAAALRHELRRSLARALAIALPALLIGLWLARPVLELIYDPAFARAESALQILLVVVVVSLLNGHLRQGLIALGRQRADLRNTTLSTGVHVLAKLALIPAFGLQGAALGTLAGEASLVLMSALTLRVAWREVPETELQWGDPSEARDPEPGA